MSHLEASAIAWTARLAVAAFLARLLIDVSQADRQRSGRTARIIWTTGGVTFLLHVVAAFHFTHGWSHHAAYEHTAQQTLAVTGFNWGGGLWFNYVFTLLWITDVAGWWIIGPEFPRRHPRWSSTVRWTFAFMMVNATVVFGPPYWKWLAGAFAATWLLLRWRQQPLRGEQCD
jgi:hypothetical protein